MRLASVLLYLLLLTHISVAQLAENPARSSAPQPAVNASGSSKVSLPPGTLPVDPKKLAAAIRDSYYHPDELSGLDCRVSIDWVAFFNDLKMNIPEDRLKIIQRLTVRAQSTRGKQTDITFDWAGQTLDTKEQVESGYKQMIGGFYQMYWPMIASFPIKSSTEIKKVEPLPDGGSTVYLPSQNINLILTVDKEHLPVHYSIDSPVMKGTIDSHYSPSPDPIPGDLRRLTGLNVVQQIGNSTINIEVSLDYQTIGGFNIPKHTTFRPGNAYSVVMDFSGCSVSKEVLLN